MALAWDDVEMMGEALQPLLMPLGQDVDVTEERGRRVSQDLSGLGRVQHRIQIDWNLRAWWQRRTLLLRFLCRIFAVCACLTGAGLSLSSTNTSSSSRIACLDQSKIMFSPHSCKHASLKLKGGPCASHRETGTVNFILSALRWVKVMRRCALMHLHGSRSTERNTR